MPVQVVTDREILLAVVAVFQDVVETDSFVFGRVESVQAIGWYVRFECVLTLLDDRRHANSRRTLIRRIKRCVLAGSVQLGRRGCRFTAVAAAGGQEVELLAVTGGTLVAASIAHVGTESQVVTLPEDSRVALRALGLVRYSARDVQTLLVPKIQNLSESTIYLLPSLS